MGAGNDPKDADRIGSADPARPPFDLVYRKAARWVWRTLRRLGVPERECADATHDVFLVVLRRLPEYEPRDRLTGWLGAICANVARRQRERGQREELMERDLWEQITQGADVGPVDEAPSSEEQTMLRELRARMLALLDQIPPERRIVLQLCDLDGLTIREAAKALGIPESTASDRLTRARAELLDAVGRMNAREHRSLTIAALIAAERMLPSLPAGVQESIWERLQRAPEFPRGDQGVDGEVDGGGGAHAVGQAVGAAGGPALVRAALSTSTGVLAAALLYLTGLVTGALWAPIRGPAPAPVTVTPEAFAATSAPAGSASSSHPMSSATASAAPAPSSSSSAAPAHVDEGLLIQKADTFLAAGQTDAAIAARREHARAFPRSALSEEREAIWIRALLRSGRVGEAQSRIERFARSYPHDPRLADFQKAVSSHPTEHP